MGKVSVTSDDDHFVQRMMIDVVTKKYIPTYLEHRALQIEQNFSLISFLKIEFRKVDNNS